MSRQNITRPPSGATARHWLIAGITGFLLVLAFPAVRDTWQVNQAGVLLNRAIVLSVQTAGGSEPAGTGRDAGGAPQGGVQTNGQTRSRSGAVVFAPGGDFLLTPRAEVLLERSLSLMESTASRSPHTASREVTIWRTYGAAARLLPSDHAFDLLFRSRNAGRLDWYGELWLGEVASSTGHWEAAAEAYRRADVSNLLVYRAEAHIKQGEEALALHELALAKESLDATVDREKARWLLLDRAGARPSAFAGMMQRPAERATTLSRIGQALLSLGRPATARPVLEQGLTIAETSSPGVTVERNLRLDLASALVAARSQNPRGLPSEADYSYYLGGGEYSHLKNTIRIQALVYQALAVDHTALTCARGGRILLKAGDESLGLSLLREAMRLDPLVPDAYIGMGEWYEGQGMGYAARSLYQAAAVHMPSDPLIASALAVSTFKTISHKEALPLLQRAAGMKSTNPWVFAFLGDCYRELGRMVEAKAAWEDGARRFPRDVSLAARLATLQSAPEPSR